MRDQRSTDVKCFFAIQAGARHEKPDNIVILRAFQI